MIKDWDRSRHENHATHVYYMGTAKEAEAAVKKSLETLSYHSFKSELEATEGTIEGEKFMITFKECGGGKISMYVRCEFSGDRDKERRIIEEIDKNLKKAE
jgi:hypothetical protein